MISFLDYSMSFSVFTLLDHIALAWCANIVVYGLYDIEPPAYGVHFEFRHKNVLLLIFWCLKFYIEVCLYEFLCYICIYVRSIDHFFTETKYFLLDKLKTEILSLECNSDRTAEITDLLFINYLLHLWCNNMDFVHMHSLVLLQDWMLSYFDS